MRRCANCKYFKSLGYMTKTERKAFIDFSKILGIEDYENYGYCTKLPMWKIVSKDSTCNQWEVKE